MLLYSLFFVTFYSVFFITFSADSFMPFLTGSYTVCVNCARAVLCGATRRDNPARVYAIVLISLKRERLLVNLCMISGVRILMRCIILS